jgi:hypothetical protein
MELSEQLVEERQAGGAPNTELMKPGTGDGARLLERPGVAFTTLAAVLSGVLWWRVLIGDRVLVPGDILYGILPWSRSAGAHAPVNRILSDVVLQTLAWQTAVHDAFGHGRLPLWNSMALSGTPLLGNDQTGALSPLTLLTLPFSPAQAVSLMMIAKLWIAGLGTAFFLRQLGAGGLAAFLAGLAFATSSALTVWLGYPNSTVVALMPLGFAALEWYLREDRPAALAVLAVDLGLMFLAGHAPTDAHLIGALAVYGVVRLVAPQPRRWKKLSGLVAAGVAGLLIGGIQVLPFLEALRNGTIFNLRLGERAGEGHLALSSVLTWVVPNSQGNPAIDGLNGRAPNFSESSGFAGIGILLLSPLGAAWLWRRRRSAALGLIGLGAVAAGIVYGPLSKIAGRLPILEVSNNARLIAVLCFVAAVLGGLGLEAVIGGARRPRSRLSLAALPIGAGGLLMLGGAWVLLYRRRGGVDALLAPVHGHIGFWVAVALISVIVALAFIVSGRWGDAPRLASSGLAVLALVEAMLYAWPYNPMSRLQEVPPPSQAMDWLRAHAGDRSVAAVFPAMIPQSATLYSLHDVSGYDTVVATRVVEYWRSADPGFKFEGNITALSRPSPGWLAAAGVGQVLVPGNEALPGTNATFKGEGVTIGAVTDVRPFAYAASKTATVSGPAAAAEALKPDPLGVVAVEGGCCGGDQGAATVTVLERDNGVVRLTIVAPAATTVVIDQAFYPGWDAQLDGHRSTIRPANILFQSVQVPAGLHDLTLRYRPSNFTIGAFLSLAGVVGVLVLLTLDRLSARRSP